MVSIIIPQVLTIIAFHVTCAASYIKYGNINEMELCNRAFPFLNDLVYKQRYIKNNKGVTSDPYWFNGELTLHKPLRGRLNSIDNEEKVGIRSNNIRGLQREHPKKSVPKPKLEDYCEVLSEAFRTNPELKNAVIKYLAQRWYDSDRQNNKKKMKKKTTTQPPQMFLPSTTPFNKVPKTFTQKEFTFRDNMDMTSVRDEGLKNNTDALLEFQEMNPTNPDDEEGSGSLDEFRGPQTNRQEIDMLEAEYNAKEQRNKFSYLPQEDDKYLKYIALFQKMFNNMNTSSSQVPTQKVLASLELATTIEPLLSIVTLPLRRLHGKKKENSTILLNESKPQKMRINSHKELHLFQ